MNVRFFYLLLSLIAVVKGISAQQLFQSPTCYDVGIAPRALVSGDFNHDGKLDIASADWVGGTTSVILGNGDGTFNAPNTYPAGSAPQSICTADFNSDGNLDLAVPNVLSNTVSLFYGLGNGQFTVATPLILDEPIWIVSGDFNLDNKADIAVALNSFGKIAVLTGDGNGGFTTQKFSSGGEFPSRIVSADFNTDGKTDLVVSNYSDGLALLKGDGLGGFVTSDSFINVPVNIQSLTIADINNDGKQDLVTAANESLFYYFIDSTVKFDFVNSPIFGFPVGMGVGGGGNAVCICVADFDEDNRLDIAASRQSTDSFSVNIGTPGLKDSFKIEAQNYYASCAHMPFGMLTADFNNDGHADLAASNEGGSNVSIFMNKLTAPNAIQQQELELKSGGIVVYPNPASTILRIKTEQPEKRELYNSTGVIQYETNGNEIDISRLAKGMYYLKCGIQRRKVVVD